jgi:hypothetical protein
MQVEIERRVAIPISQIAQFGALPEVPLDPIISPSTHKSSCASTEVAPGVVWTSLGHYLGGYQYRLLGGPLGLPDLRCTVPDGVKHKDYRGEVLG